MHWNLIPINELFILHVWTLLHNFYDFFSIIISLLYKKLEEKKNVEKKNQAKI